MARGVYTVTWQAVAVTAAQDLFLLLPSSVVPIDILEILLGQHTDFGDAQDENIRIAFMRGMTVNGSGGSAPAAVPTCPGDSAATATFRANDTTLSNTGTIVTLKEWNPNVRAGMIELPIPKNVARVAANTKAAIRLMAAPVDSLTMSGTLTYEELA